jgi:Double zinc ribbon
MHDTVACPSCQARLLLPLEPPPGGMTCPRCQTQVPYQAPPLVESVPNLVAAAPADIQLDPTELEPPMSAGFSTCPYCGKSVESDWLFCPHCEEPLREDSKARRHNGVVDDVKQPGTRVKIMLALMGVLGGISTFWYFLIALSSQSPELVLFGVLAFLFVAIINTGIMYHRMHHEPRKINLARVLIATFTMLGFLLAFGCSVMLAVGVFAFVICLAGGIPR